MGNARIPVAFSQLCLFCTGIAAIYPLRNNDQRMAVVYGGVSSCFLDLKSGVSQGSIFCPLLFLPHDSNIPYAAKHGRLGIAWSVTRRTGHLAVCSFDVIIKTSAYYVWLFV